MTRFTPYLCLFLSALLLNVPLSAADLAGAPDPHAAAQPSAAAGGAVAQVRVGTGEEMEFAAGSRTAKGIPVEVLGADGSPVADAAVFLRLPDSGPTGTFPGGAHSAVAYTDANGRAQIEGIQWSAATGSFAMRITASKGTSHAGVLVEATVGSSEAATPNASAPAATAEASNPAPPPPVLAAMPSVIPATAPRAASIDPAPTVEVAEARTADIPSALPEPPPAEPAATARSGASEANPSHPGTPARATLPGAQTSTSLRPAVTVTNTGASGPKSHGSKTKWLIAAAAVAAGAGVGMMAMHGGKTAAAPAAAALSLGTPSISIGHP